MAVALGFDGASGTDAANAELYEMITIIPSNAHARLFNARQIWHLQIDKHLE